MTDDDKALQEAHRKLDNLRAELDRREEIWLGRLQAADARAAHIWQLKLKLNPPFSRLSMNPGDRVITADEWPKTERTVIEVSRVVYFRDFLRSFWRRLTGRRAA